MGQEGGAWSEPAETNTTLGQFTKKRMSPQTTPVLHITAGTSRWRGMMGAGQAASADSFSASLQTAAYSYMVGYPAAHQVYGNPIVNCDQ